MDDALRKLAQSVHLIRSLHRGTGGRDVISVGDPRREENLARHMEGAKTPSVLYHGTHGDIKQPLSLGLMLVLIRILYW